jgi:starvation-inducible outer membrane lipoprotein
MKILQRSKHHGEALALILTASLCAFTPGLTAQTTSTPQQAQQQQNQQQEPLNQQQAKTFTGKIVKLQTGQFALVTGQTPEGKIAGHFLDDQDDAKKYADKQVTVTGTFDTASNTIHVTNIQAA